MIQILLLIASLLFPSAQAACPAGSNCVQYEGQVPYNATGGTTARQDKDRWVDNYVEAPEIGVDCTNTSDSTTAIQNFFTANPNGHLRFPLGCTFFTTSTITISSAAGTTIDSDTPAGQAGVALAQWQWQGTNGGTACGGAATSTFSSCQYVLSFQSVDHPTIENIQFVAPGGGSGWLSDKCPDGFLLFDHNPSGHTPTAGRVLKDFFGNGSCANPNFVAVNISPTATDNHENYILNDDVTVCSNSDINMVARDGVTNGTTTVTSASAPFTSGMVGQRIRLTFDNDSNPGSTVGQSAPFSNGNFDTFITGFTNSSTITVAAAVTFTETNVSIAVGQAYGTAYRNGANQNALQQVFSSVQYNFCQYGVFIAGGGVQIEQLTGFASDVGVFVGGFISQNTTEDFYAAENDYIALIDGPGALTPFEFRNGRLSNGNQAGNGFLQIGGQDVLLQNILVEVGLPNTNSALIAPYQQAGVDALGSITAGSGYVNGTYTSVPLAGGSCSGVKATVVVSGTAVTSVTVTTAGSCSNVGDILTTANTNLGGSGSGFSVPTVAINSPTDPNQNFFGSITSLNNNWTEGFGGQTITWARLGLNQFVNPPVALISNTINDTAANVPYGNTVGCGLVVSLGTACFGISYGLPGAGTLTTGIGIAVNLYPAIVDTGTQVGFQVTSGGSNPGAGGGGLTGFQTLPPTNPVSVLTGFDAAWNTAAVPMGGQTNVYGFHAETPSSITEGTLTNLYGFECDQQKITNVTNGYCFYNANAADLNYFAGPIIAAPTIVSDLPSCTSSIQGARMFVTDQATAVAYHGAVTGSGSSKQSVICDGTNWYQD